MISVVYWLYHDDTLLTGGARVYTSEYVNIQLRMLRRHLHVPFKVICLTDNPEGIDPAIEVLPDPVKSDGPIQSKDPRFPRCYRRLWNWSLNASMLGDRILAMDLDTVLTRDITPLVDRDEPLVVWKESRGPILGCCYLLDTGAFTHVWNNFSFRDSPRDLLAARLPQSDQGWLNFALRGRDLPAWTGLDGVYLPPVRHRSDLPESARLVSFGGPEKPWMAKGVEKYPWISEHWK